MKNFKLKSKILILLIVSLFFFSIRAQSQKMPYDSIVAKISDKTVSIDEKQGFIRLMSHLPIEEQISISKMVADVVRHEKDKARLITIFSILDNLCVFNGQIEEGKAFLDSAFMYLDETSDVNALGALYYRMGNYYFSTNDISTAHQYFYKAIDNYEKSPDKKQMLSFIYYNIGSTYYETEDMESLSKIVNRMLTVKFEGDQRIYYDNIYSFIASYYQLKSTKDSVNRILYLDSTIHYLNKAIETYDLYKTDKHNLSGSTRMACQNYLSLARTLLIKESPDFDIALKNLEKSRQYMRKNDTLSLKKYHGTKAFYFSKKGEFKKALEEYKAEEEILNNIKYRQSKQELLTFYSEISKTYEKLNDHKNALKYLNLAYDLRKDIDNTQRYEIVKELDTKYETAEKELEISHLNEERQKARFKMTLVLSIGIFFILLLLFAFLHNRMKRLKREKEAVILTAKIKEKELETQTILKESELKQMRHYLDGLEVERNRVSKDLHDVVGNKLYILDQNLKSIENMPDSIFQQIEELYSQTRDISHNLISPSFQYITLPEIIFNFIEEVKGRTNIQFHLNITENYNLDNLPTAISHEIYRIAQECVGNIIKHSFAKDAWIDLSYNEKLIIMEIKDDGIGFDPQKKVKGIGLRVIQDRCKTLNGNFILTSGKGQGCNIKVAFSFNQQDADGLQ